MKNILMCRPNHFGVSYEINPWMADQIGKVDREKALRQWDKLVDAISKHAIVRVMEGVEHLPDLVFTANAGIVVGTTAILSNFSNKERQLEAPHFGKWFLDNGFAVVKPDHRYEGEGDHLVDSRGNHWMGSGFRTDPAAAKEIQQIVKANLYALALVDPRWYHLDTCFCPLPNGELLWYPGAFSTLSQKFIRKMFVQNIEISLEDALQFSCNCLAIGNHLFLPTNTDASMSLARLGYDVHEFDLSEFMKAGGAAKCLTLYV